MISKISLLLAGSAAVTSAIGVKTKKSKCPFGFTSATKPEGAELVQDQPKYPSDVLTCSKQKVLQTEMFSKAQYEQLAMEIIAQMHTSEDKTKYAACLLRLEGHDLMDFRRIKNKKGKIMNNGPGSGGSDGCVNFEDGDNAGLPSCLAWTGIETIYDDWCDQISLADLMVLAAEVTVGSISVDYDKEDPWRGCSMLTRFQQQFKFGRKTLETCPDNHGLMPNPENGCEDLKEVFVDNIYKVGLSKQRRWGLTAALSGAHTIGSAKPENSGYDGMWGDPANQAVFNNDYFKNIIVHGWGPNRAVGGNENKNQWILIDQSPDDEKSQQMMLNTDMCLFYQDNRLHAECMKEEHKGKIRNRKICQKFQRKGTYINAKKSTCCAWTQFRVLEKKGILNDHSYCAMDKGEMIDYKTQLKKQNRANGIKTDFNEQLRPQCCTDEQDDSFGDCDSFQWPKGPAMEEMLTMAESNLKFYDHYLKAWRIATENGWKLKPLV